MVDVDQSVATLVQHKDEWATLPIARKLDHLQKMRQKTDDVAERWVNAAVKAKRVPADSPLAGEEWMSGPYAVLTWINAVQETLTEIAAGRDPLEKFAVRQRTDGQTVITVYPHRVQERLLLNGFSAEVWMQPGTTPARGN